MSFHGQCAHKASLPWETRILQFDARLLMCQASIVCMCMKPLKRKTSKKVRYSVMFKEHQSPSFTNNKFDHVGIQSVEECPFYIFH